MKLSLNWIKDYVDLPEGLTASQIAHDLTMSTVEVEETRDLGASLADIVVGRILEVTPHPNADRLRLCKVDIGDGEIKDIVCGGSNVAPELLVAVAKPGAVVRWHGEGDPVTIGCTKIRGIASYGMICSSGEIGLAELFPITRESEIMDLSPFQPQPGTPLADALNLNDIILEIDNKSLTNRPDLWAHYGIAREFAALYKCPLKPLPQMTPPATAEGLKITILDPKRCPRYAALLMENVAPTPSPFWLQSRIWRVGMRPINILVDITNYVMLSVGQPTHGFDATHVKGEICVRVAKPSETLTLLNGKELNLTDQDLVIADQTEPLALAGIMGGSKDSILDNTTKMILEVANFHSIGTRKSAQRFDLRTEASVRFEKAIDPQRVDLAISMALLLFKQECPQAEATAFLDCYPTPLDSAPIALPLSLLERQMGQRLPDEEIHSLLSSLGFSIKQEGDILHVTPPSWRSTGDIKLPDDIIEEIARLHGYENFEAVAPTMLFRQAINQRSADLERHIREYLAYRCDMQEIFTYPWMEDSFIEATQVDCSKMLSLSTPPAPNQSRLRTTLIPNLVQATSENLRYFQKFRIFELTQIFLDQNYKSNGDEREKLPEQRRTLGAAFVGEDPVQLFREAKGILESLGRFAQTPELTFKQEENAPWCDAALWINVFQEDRKVGTLALLSSRAARASGIRRASVILFELDVEQLLPLPSRQNHYHRLPEYPQVEFDLSVLFDEAVTWSEIQSIVVKSAELVKDIRFVDEYRGSQVPEGKKSIMIRLILGSDSTTLTSDQVEKTAMQIARKLEKKLGGELRGSISEQTK